MSKEHGILNKNHKTRARFVCCNMLDAHCCTHDTSPTPSITRWYANIKHVSLLSLLNSFTWLYGYKKIILFELMRSPIF